MKIIDPWEDKLHIPQRSMLSASCRPGPGSSAGTGRSCLKCLEWFIKLPDRAVEDTFTGTRRSILNQRGFFEVEDRMDMYIHLVNNLTTPRINGTVLKCVNVTSGQVNEETTIIIYGKDNATVAIHTHF